MTTETQIGFTWVAPQFDGGSPVIDYRISYKLTGNYIQLASGVTETRYSISGLEKG